MFQPNTYQIFAANTSFNQKQRIPIQRIYPEKLSRDTTHHLFAETYLPNTACNRIFVRFFSVFSNIGVSVLPTSSLNDARPLFELVIFELTNIWTGRVWTDQVNHSCLIYTKTWCSENVGISTQNRLKFNGFRFQPNYKNYKWKPEINFQINFFSRFITFRRFVLFFAFFEPKVLTINLFAQPSCGFKIFILSFCSVANT